MAATGVPEAPPPPITPGRPRGKRFLYGCLFTFLFLFLILVVGILSIRSWLRTPGTMLDPSLLADERTALFVEIHLHEDDPGVREILKATIRAQRHQSAGQLDRGGAPEAFRMIFGSAMEREPTDAEINKILPVAFVMTKQEDDAGQERPALFTVSFPGAGNSLKMVDYGMSLVFGWGKSKAKKQAHAGEDIYYLPGDDGAIWLCFAGTDVLLSQQDEPIASGLDRITRARGGAPSLAVAPVLAARPPGAAIFIGARAGHAASAVEILEKAAPAFAAAVRQVTQDSGDFVLWTKLKSADLMEGEVRIKEAPGRPVREPSEITGSITLPYKQGDVTISIAPIAKQPDERVAYQIAVNGIKSAASRTIELVVPERRHRRKPSGDESKATEAQPTEPSPPPPSKQE